MNPDSSSLLAGADDRTLAGRAADGDTAAFAVLVRRHGPSLRAYARRILSGNADVDDVVQDAFITAWDRLPELDNPERVKSWLMRITSRKAIDRIRAARRHTDVTQVDLPTSERASPPRLAEVSAGLSALSGILHRMPDNERECWVLREIGGYSYEEISNDLGVPVSTVRGLLARARKHLIVRMEQWR